MADAPSVPPRLGAPGSTKGTISCGTKRCAAGVEACVFDDHERVWTCVGAKSDRVENGAFFCDDGTDCAPGKTCCESFASASEYFECTTRDNDCANEVCVPGDGAACPKGQVCEKGFCNAQSRATCGKHAPCPAERPICVVGKDTKCVSASEAAAIDTSVNDVGILACTQPADCGPGMQCCTAGAMGAQRMYCAVTCDIANTHIVCSTPSDCARLRAVSSSHILCGRPKDDEAVNKYTPAWTKLCFASP